MEIGQEQVDRAEAVARQDEEPGLAVEFADPAALVGGAFEEAQARRSDRDDAAAAGAGGVDPGGRLGTDHPAFGMHPMPARVLGLDRQERAGPDMQRHRRPLGAARGDRRHQRGREMQPRGRRGNGALGAGEHRLVIDAVLRVAAGNSAGRPLDVGRQRHRAMAGERRAKRRPLACKTQRHRALGALLRRPRPKNPRRNRCGRRDGGAGRPWHRPATRRRPDRAPG